MSDRHRGRRLRCARQLLTASLAVAALLSVDVAAQDPAAVRASPGAVPGAICGPGSRPETGLQGQVPLADRTSGRALRGYQCNLQLLGHYRGEGTSWISQSFGTCAYLSTRLGAARSPGVQVLDVRNPRKPVLVTTLRSPSMLASWESLKVNPRRKLLAAVAAAPPVGNGAAMFDVYDIGRDCRHPRLLNGVDGTTLGLPSNVMGHEGTWAPDGRTYWASGYGGVAAIDVADPAHPRVVGFGVPSPSSHGVALSADGNTMYVAQAGNLAPAGSQQDIANGLRIFDVSDIQHRRPLPRYREVGSLYWPDGGTAQTAIPFSSRGRSYVLFTDELRYGSARIIDVTRNRPRLVSHLRLAVQLPSASAVRDADTAHDGFFGYNAHYCSLDRTVNPTAAACAFFEAGIRVFDLRDPAHPREIAYFHPPSSPGRNAQLDGSEHASGTGAVNDLSADWCSSPPRFVGHELWVACQDYGFMALAFTNHAYPLAQTGAAKGS
ncbi:MAG: hypothetical protein JWL79_3106 [Frankiales bacterium]|nr:hypothetical protein [Frankiales bacterium]